MSDTSSVDPQPKPRRGRRSWWRSLLALVLALILLPVAERWYARFSAQQELDEAVAELDESDPLWKLEDVEANRQIIPPAQNSALIVTAVRKQMPRRWPSEKLTAPWTEFTELAPTAQLSEVHTALLCQELQAVPEALAQARKIETYRKGRFPIEYDPSWLGTILEHAQWVREVGALLSLSATLEAQDGKLERAWHDSLATYRVGSSLGDEPLLISQLVRLALRKIAMNSMERTLAQGEITNDDLLAQIQEILQQDSQEPLFVYALKGERGGMYIMCNNLLAGKVSLDSAKAGQKRAPTLLEQACLRVIGTPIIRYSCAWLLDYMTRAIEAAKLPPGERYEKLHALEDKARSVRGDWNLLLASLLVPSLMRVGDATIRSDGDIAVTITALACERYRLKHKQWPPNLDVLVKEGLLKQVPADPYDGQPLRYRQTDNGIIVYSSGPDGNNQGDALDNPYLEHPQVRVEFRLWNVDKRRQPHQPRPRAEDMGPADVVIPPADNEDGKDGTQE